jgi:hypothetical protein
VDFHSLREMAEALEGTFTITVLDSQNYLYFVRGNNPMCIMNYPKDGFYLYASTEEILMKSVKKLGLGKHPSTEVPIQMGEILRIDAAGDIRKTAFDDSRLWCQPRYHWGWETDWPPFSNPTYPTPEEDYLEELKGAAEYMGYQGQMVELLYEAGYAFSDIEEMLYDPELLEACLEEVMEENSVSQTTLLER